MKGFYVREFLRYASGRILYISKRNVFLQGFWRENRKAIAINEVASCMKKINTRQRES